MDTTNQNVGPSTNAEHDKNKPAAPAVTQPTAPAKVEPTPAEPAKKV